MLKFLIVRHSTDKPISKFEPKDLKDLPKDLVKFINNLPKGDKLHPLSSDTVMISTYKTPEIKKYGGHIIPAERNVELRADVGNNTYAYACLTDNKEKLSKKEGFPISIKGMKNAIENIGKSISSLKEAILTNKPSHP